MSICGETDGTPTKYGVAIVDVYHGVRGCAKPSRALR
jgi:hypothetical protein